MTLLTLPLAIQKLAGLGDGWRQPTKDWIDYRTLGISPQDSSVLIEILQMADKFWVEELQDDPRSWIPVHAWRALGQFQSVDALPLLISMLPQVDDEENDLIQEEFGEVFGLIGPAAIPSLDAYLNDLGKGLWSRLTAAEGLAEIGKQFPEVKGQCTDGLVHALERHLENDPIFNAYLIWYLAQLKETAAAPLIQQVYQSERVDDSVLGDFEDYQVEAGLIPKRLTPRPRYRISPAAFSDGEPMDPEEHRLRAIEQKGEKKAKKKRKEAKTKRKKNRKKK